MAHEVVHDENVAGFRRQVLLTSDDVIHKGKKPAEFDAAIFANLLRCCVGGRLADHFVDALELTVNLQLFTDVLQDFKRHSGKTRFERIAVSSQNLECLKGIGKREAALEIHRQLVQRRCDAELGG